MRVSVITPIYNRVKDLDGGILKQLGKGIIKVIS